MIKKWLFSCMLILLSSWSFASPNPNSAAFVVGLAGKCMDVKGGQLNDGAEVILYTCHGGENQKWLKQGDQIKTVNGKCLDVKDGNASTGARVILWSCHNGDNQKWRYINGTIQSKMGSCLEVVNGDPRDGTPLQTSVCQGKASQQWSVEDRINAQPQPLPQPVPRPIPQPYPGNLSHSVKIIGLANKCLDVKSK